MKQFFQAIYGNEKTKHLIGRDILDKKQHHAYILEGPAGSGKHLLAHEMAKALLCEQNAELFPCGICSHCKKIDAQSYTDILFINAGDKATISVESVRDALSTLSYAPDEGNYKIYVIEDAEKMTVQAQNALLLSLEEPPAYAVFLLLVTDAAALLETIRSRAVTFSMEIFSTEAVFTFLMQSGITASHQRLREAAAVSGGCIGAAKDFLLGEDDAAALSIAAQEWINLLCTGTVTEALIHCSGMKYSRAEFDTFLNCAMAAVRDRIAAKLDSKDFLLHQNKKQIQDISANTLGKLSELYDALYNAREEIVHTNASAYPVLCTLTEKHFSQN